jgi:MinD-like ATPase involved in chromosome partitioning or flagellar assembly
MKQILKGNFMNKRLPAVLLATRNPAALESIPPDFQTREAISTVGISSALNADPFLILFDPHDILECGGIPLAIMTAAINSARERGAVVLFSDQFLGNPQYYLGQALLARGLRSGIRYMPPHVVMLTNYCGGVGKTTLSLTLARYFRTYCGLSAAIVEAGVGASSLKARLGQATSLYDFVTQSFPARRWEGVDIFSSDGWEAESLARDERTPAALKRITHDHTLTILDAFPTNPLWKYALELVTDVIVVSTPRNDSLTQAATLLEKLNEEGSALPQKPSIHLALNQVRSLGERIGVAGQANAWIGYDERMAEHLDGSLAEPLMGLLYPNWSPRKSRSSGKRRIEKKEKA